MNETPARTAYVPKAGGLADRAISLLRSLPPGTRLSTTKLAAALGISAGNVSNNLKGAVVHGWIVAHGFGKGYGLPAMPQAAVEPEEVPAVDEPQQRIVDAAVAPVIRTHGPSSVFDLGSSAVNGSASPRRMRKNAAPTAEEPLTPPEGKWLGWKPARRRKKKVAAQRPPKKPNPPAIAAQPKTHAVTTALPRPLACALFNTGDLVIEAPNQPPLRLTRPQARELVNYLELLRDAMGESV